MIDTSRKGVENVIKIHYGMTDYLKFYNKKYGARYGKLSKAKYNEIISEANNLIGKMITDEGADFNLPFQLGTIGIRKYKPRVQLSVNGELINKLPVNPMETRKLWDSNPEAKEKNIYVRYTNKHSNGFVFSLFYFKKKAIFKNKNAYVLICKRGLKRRLAKNIKDKVIDAFLI